MDKQTSYYQPEGLALEIFQKRYQIHKEETWQEACDRVASHVAAAEIGEDIVKWRGVFAESLKKNHIMPAGRIWYGSGRPKGQLLNCFVIPSKDSREGWGKNASDMIIISGTGGGVGTNYSPIRPRNSKITGSGGVASGAVSLMRGINAFGEEMKAGGGRRVALMMALNINHGDIVEFLDTKLDLKKLNNANVSVIFDDDPEQFFAVVKARGNLELKHNGQVIGTASAEMLWKKIISNALKGGEPGLLNGFLANRMNNVWYFKQLVCTNPCGEIWLVEYDCCDLGALVLPRFVVDQAGEMTIDWASMRDAIVTLVRFLDDVLTVNNYPLAEIKETCFNIRRIGLGVMGLHDMLLLLGMKYNSDAGLEMIDRLMKFIKEAAYEASIDLAIEKGAFPMFDAEKFLKSGFIKTLKPSIKSRIRKNGIRNCAILTIAPTGTTSMVAAVTSGIEPMFAPAYRRRFRDGEVLKEEIVIHPLLKEFHARGRSSDHFQGAYDLSIRDHFEVQRICQKHLDNACSKTINVPQGVSEEELSELYMEYLPELKGVTIYPEGSRADQPLTPLTLEEAIVHAENVTTISLSEEGTRGCKSGACEI